MLGNEGEDCRARGEARQMGRGGHRPQPTPSALPAQKPGHHNSEFKARKMIGNGKGGWQGQGKGDNGKEERQE